jgi:hypothetical protein
MARWPVKGMTTARCRKALSSCLVTQNRATVVNEASSPAEAKEPQDHLRSRASRSKQPPDGYAALVTRAREGFEERGRRTSDGTYGDGGFESRGDDLLLTAYGPRWVTFDAVVPGDDPVGTGYRYPWIRPFAAIGALLLVAALVTSRRNSDAPAAGGSAGASRSTAG